ncbi:MAG: hypothetical protein H6741_31715 [Alphaproteobacteria bacterium]|nr:hypothetical protein [Alphaproteobacteria bacterium]
MPPQTQIAIRLPAELIERADALIPTLEGDRELRTWGRVSRAAVIRLAVLRGLEALEREHGVPGVDEPDQER